MNRKALDFLRMSCNYPVNVISLADAIIALDIHTQQIIAIIEEHDDKTKAIKAIRDL